MAQHFLAVIYKQGINPCVDVPEHLSQVLGKKGYIPVRGTLNGQPFQATLVPVKNNPYRLFINGEMRKSANVDVGDEISVVLEFDARPREIPIPEVFAQALDQNPQARAVYERLTPSRRKDILLYMNSLKKPESLQKVIDRVIKDLLGEA